MCKRKFLVGVYPQDAGQWWAVGASNTSSAQYFRLSSILTRTDPRTCVFAVLLLYSRVQQRNGNTSAGLDTRRSGGDPMECSTSFEVVAEVLPLSPGSRAGSMCSASSNAGSEGHPTAVDMPQQASTMAPRPSTSSAALLVSLQDKLGSFDATGQHGRLQLQASCATHAGG
jgi:hypothetical protein